MKSASFMLIFYPVESILTVCSTVKFFKMCRMLLKKKQLVTIAKGILFLQDNARSIPPTAKRTHATNFCWELLLPCLECGIHSRRFSSVQALEIVPCNSEDEVKRSVLTWFLHCGYPVNRWDKCNGGLH